MIEQVKGHSYSVPALLGNNSLLPMEPEGKNESKEEAVGDKSDKSWLRVSLASPKLRENVSARSIKHLQCNLSVKITATYFIEFLLQSNEGALLLCNIPKTRGLSSNTLSG
jgi:phosphatidylserine decarboxylase